MWWFASGWIAVVAWGFLTLVMLPWVAGPVGLWLTARDRREQERPLAASAYFAGALLSGLLWLAVVGYCGWRAWTAWPAAR